MVKYKTIKRAEVPAPTKVRVIKKADREKAQAEPKVEEEKKIKLRDVYGVVRATRVLRFKKRYDNFDEAWHEAQRLSRNSKGHVFLVVKVVKVVKVSGESLEVGEHDQ
jgi:hypothetical protein